MLQSFARGPNRSPFKDLNDFPYGKYMNHQTRQLVALLADDGTARILDALRQKSSAAPQLVRATGASERTIVQVLELLHAHGVVEWEMASRGSRGRPSRVWRIAAASELVAFERACKELKRALLKRDLDAIESQ
jgi:predicted ArsR family transcriptional regulator